MKSRELLTTPVLIVKNYQIMPHSSGKYLHSFTPETTSTTYQFIAAQEPVLESGQRYNIGYTAEDGVNWVDMAATARAYDVDKDKSFYVARELGRQIRAIQTKKSDERVVHRARDGYYLGKKYAWRLYGMAIARGAFEAYLRDISHPSVPCLTDDNDSIAYKEEGLSEAMDALCKSAIRIDGNRFKSPRLPSKKSFQIKGISAITDKK